VAHPSEQGNGPCGSMKGERGIFDWLSNCWLPIKAVFREVGHKLFGSKQCFFLSTLVSRFQRELSLHFAVFQSSHFKRRGVSGCDTFLISLLQCISLLIAEVPHHRSNCSCSQSIFHSFSNKALNFQVEVF